MIRINRQTDYAFRVVLALAKQPYGERLSTSTIRKQMLIPPALLHRIVADLAQGGFIDTYPGRGGGVQLSRPADQINMLQVIEHFEGPIHLSDCFVEEDYCPFEDNCPVRGRVFSIQRVLRKELEQVNFEELAADSSQNTQLLQVNVMPEEASAY